MNDKVEEKNVIDEMLPLAVNEKVLELCEQRVEMLERHKKEEEAQHHKLWAMVHDTYPLITENANYSLDMKYVEAGIVMLKQSKKCDHKGKGFESLAKLLASKLT